MSTYALMDGAIHFSDKEAFETAISVLKNGNWIDSNGFWVKENGVITDDKAIVHNSSDMEILIPRGYYRNLVNILGTIIKGSDSAVGKWASTDGMFRGGEFSGSGIDLKNWAANNGMDDEPKEEDYADPDEYFESLYTWQDEIVEAFIGG